MQTEASPSGIARTERSWATAQVQERASPLWMTITLTTLAIGWCVMRLVGLELSPVGMSSDEGLAGLHVQCYAETGMAADGKPLSLFATGLGGGLYTPAYLTALFVWTRVFGISLGSLRALSGVFSLLTIVGLWLLARHLTDKRTAWLVFLAAALSPWSFQLSRLSTDAPAAPAFLVWGTYLFLRSAGPIGASFGGIVLALAAYTYPPLRVQVALLVPLLLLLERRRLGATRLVAFLGSMLVTGLPLLKLLLDGSLMERSRALSIFTASYVQGHRAGLPRSIFLIKQVLDNLHEHLRPSYLFFTGDPNLRHSMQRVGELGFIDVLGLALALAAIGVLMLRGLFPGTHGRRSSPETLHLWRLAAVAVVVGLLGTLPAALCWEGLPHAYRSIGAYPAVALFTGACLGAAWKWGKSRLLPIAVLGLALAQTVHFFPNYFGDYRERSYSWFDGDLWHAAQQHDKAAFEKIAAGLPELAFRYHLVRSFGHTCASSRTEAQRIIAGH